MGDGAGQGRATQGSAVLAAQRSATLKICIFATGLAGIVAEYVMATLASYLLGDAIVHWTMTISCMMFAMGVGSRLSRFVDEELLLDAFVGAELVLSLAVAVAAPAVYLLAVWIPAIGTVIYAFSFLIGLLVGLELPLATRLNDRFEELRLNVSAVIEKDYYGALFGGVFFAFFALPKLGLTYTPILLGAVNFAVAGLLFIRFRTLLVRRRLLTGAAALIPALLLTLAVFAEPIVVFGEQMKYRDVVVYTEQTRFQRIVMTRWKNDHWLYLDGSEQFSSYDEELYHEPLVHPALAFAARRRHVLILGGGDGLAAREVLKWADVERLTVVDLDPAVTRLARSHPVLLELNGGALDDPRVAVLNEDAYDYLLATGELFDIILVDLPDPKTVSLARLYSRPFYELAARQLTPGGVLVTQATSPFFSRRAFLSILKSVGAAGLVAVPYHNHIPTMGEWGWVLGWKRGHRAGGVNAGSVNAGGVVAVGVPSEVLRDRLAEIRLDGIETRFLNHGAMLSMLHFGKGVLDDLSSIEVSEESDLHVFSYYRDGAWDLY